MSAPNRNVAWIKPQEPSFLKAFKNKVGYREPDTIGKQLWVPFTSTVELSIASPPLSPPLSFLPLPLESMLFTEAKRARVAPESEGGDGGRGEGGGGDEEREDELPTVVVMKKGDVGEEEYQKYREMMKEIG